MTIIYQYKIATASLFGFFKLLACWKGSVYKLLFKETLIFGSVYTIISLVYRLALDASQRRAFEHIVEYCNSYTNLIPVSFVLGFYVSIVVHRWWQQFTNVPWPDRTLFIMGSYLPGQDERGRILRRTVARYMLFGLILILRSISVAVMKRFPTIDHIVDAGFITSEEAVEFENVSCKYNKFWVPIVWANHVLTQARKDGRIESEIGFRLVMEQLADYRDKCSLCFVYDWITIPLVYTQVVTLAVYMFFGACLVGRQYTESQVEGHPDLYIPFFTLLQFFFYMGWLKVAEQLINPFGEDDDDFDMNWLIDRHTTVAMCLVDQCHGYSPPLVKDAHFNEIVSDLPYTEASMASRRPNFLGSTYNLARPSVQEQKVIPPSNLLEMPQQHGRRGRSHTTIGHLGGSLWSLYGFKPNLQKAHLTESRDTVQSSTMSNGYGPAGFHSSIAYSEYSPMIQRHVDQPQGMPNHASHEDLPPEYVPLRRARASSGTDHKPLTRVCDPDTDRVRKWSFPLSLLRKKQEKEVSERMSHCSDDLGWSVSSFESKLGGGESQPLLEHYQPSTQQRPTSRFTVEPVMGDHEAELPKHSRNKQIIDKHIGHLSVSRAPVLSAIEEGNTIRSIKDIVPNTSATSLEQLDKPDTVIDCYPTTIAEELSDSVFWDDDKSSIGDADDILHEMEENKSHQANVDEIVQKEKRMPVRRKSSTVRPSLEIPEIIIEEF